MQSTETHISKDAKEIGDKTGDIQILQSLEHIIFGLSMSNIKESVDSSLKHISEEFVYSFNIVVSRIIYSFFIVKFQDELCFEYLRELERKEKEIISNSNNKVIKIFTEILISLSTQESNYLISKMIKKEMIESIGLHKQKNLYFAQYMSKNDLKDFSYDRFGMRIIKNFEELSKNDWELHKKLIDEGVNPNEIAKIIRNDEIEKLQEISSQINFDFNQYVIPSLYERCSFINQYSASLIEYAAFFGAIKCFKYLLMSGAKVENAGKYAVAGGNEEIIHLCEQNHSSFEGAYETAIEFHRDDIFKYLYENINSFIKNKEKLGEKCILCNNYEILLFLQKNGMKIDESMIKISIKHGNIFLIKYFFIFHQIPRKIILFSIKLSNVELTKYILKQKGVDMNVKNICLFNLKYILLILFFKTLFGNDLYCLKQHL